MDRRSFLSRIGLGAAAAVAAPKLFVPEPTTKIALPERRIFTPPAGGWPTWGANESALGYIQRLDIGGNHQFLIYGPMGWEVVVPSVWPEVDLTGAPRLEAVGDAQGYITSVDYYWHKPRGDVRYVGVGQPPSIDSLPNGSRIQVFHDVKFLDS